METRVFDTPKGWRIVCCYTGNNGEKIERYELDDCAFIRSVCIKNPNRNQKAE